MGACCSKDETFVGVMVDEVDEKKYQDEEEADIRNGDGGARVRLQGSSRFISIFTQQGRKGINQDAMTVWEDFTGEKDVIFCGVFDGHGPSGHHVAHHVRDILPSKLSSAFKLSQLSGCNCGDNGKDNNDDSEDSHDNDNCHNSLFSSWKASFIKSFKEMDEELSVDSAIDTYCSGTTAVTILKKGDHLVIANLGDSRAVLCTRGNKNQLVPIQLTIDLKPNLPSEAERIKNCKGRVFAMPEERDVFRLWMPDENCPGLAMARAFGDFCLKDYGLISIPDVSYRKLTDRDEFVVLATDGVWDVLTNEEVIKLVASARKRSMAAKMVVDRAVRGWRSKYPGSKVDDCAVICLFLKYPPLLTKSMSEVTRDIMNHPELAVSHHSGSIRSKGGLESEKEEWSALAGVSRVNSLVKLPRFASSVLSWRKSAKDFEDVET